MNRSSEVTKCEFNLSIKNKHWPLNLIKINSNKVIMLQLLIDNFLLRLIDN